MRKVLVRSVSLVALLSLGVFFVASNYSAAISFSTKEESSLTEAISAEMTALGGIPPEVISEERITLTPGETVRNYRFVGDASQSVVLSLDKTNDGIHYGVSFSLIGPDDEEIPTTRHISLDDIILDLGESSSTTWPFSYLKWESMFWS